MTKLKDLTGQKFGKLTVIKRAENDKKGQARWLCKCDCGNEIITLGYSLISNHTKSCGCIQGKTIHHGLYKHRLYHIWSNICQRCSNPNNISYKFYGIRGIKVCDEWKNDFMGFYDWAINNGYEKNLTIDRIDVNGNYEPENCRWTDYKTQARNRRNNRLITINGETHCLLEWCEIYKISYFTLYARLKIGMDIVTAITKPKEERTKRLNEQLD